MISLGIDVGGTHTDLVAVNSEGEILAVDKAKTTKDDIAQAIISIISEDFEDLVRHIRKTKSGTHYYNPISLKDAQ